MSLDHILSFHLLVIKTYYLGIGYVTLLLTLLVYDRISL